MFVPARRKNEGFDLLVGDSRPVDIVFDEEVRGLHLLVTGRQRKVFFDGSTDPRKGLSTSAKVGRRSGSDDCVKLRLEFCERLRMQRSLPTGRT
jgi:hypothetical protein